MSEASWEQEPIYVEARNQLDPVLLKMGFKRDYERFDWSSFGSIYSTYRQAQGLTVSLGWEGRDALLYASIDENPNEYNPIFESTTGLDRASATTQAEQIKKLVAAVSGRLQQMIP